VTPLLWLAIVLSIIAAVWIVRATWRALLDVFRAGRQG
jgi:hypothetical protein